MNQRQIKLILIFLFTVSIVVRLPNLNRPLSRHYEHGTATILRHLQIWYEDGGLKHKFCLIGTYNNKADKNINNQGRLRDSEGNFYFTSYPPFATVFPYILFRVLGIYPNVLSLEVFNLILHSICCFLVFQIVSLITVGYYTERPNIPAFVAFIMYLFSPATLWFHSNAYFQDIAVQPLFILGTYLFLRFIVDGAKRVYYVLLGLINFFMIFTEWLGVFFAFSIFLYFLTDIKRQEVRRILYIITITSIASLTLITWQYSQIDGLGSFTKISIKRYLGRTGFSQQESCNLKLEYLPCEVKFPHSLKGKIYYDMDRGVLKFNGIMSREEKQQLLKLSSDDLYKKAVEELFRQSRWFGASFTCLSSWGNLVVHYVIGYLPFLVFLFAMALRDFVLSKEHFTSIFYKNRTTALALYLCTVPVILHHFVFFNFTVVHDYSVLKSGVLIAILIALLFHKFSSNENKTVREKIAILVFCLMVFGSILQYLVINCYFLKGHDHYQKIGEEIARMAKKEETVFIKTNLLYAVPSQIVFYAHRNIALWDGESKAKELLNLNNVDRGIVFTLDKENSRIIKNEYVAR